MNHTYFYIGPGLDSQRHRPGIARWSTASLLALDRGQAIARPNYNAFRLFAMLHDGTQIPVRTNDDRVVAIAAAKGDEIAVLLTYYEPLQRDFASPQLQYLAPDWSRRRNVRLSLRDIPFERYRIERYAIDQAHSNVFTLGVERADLELVTEQAESGPTFEVQLDIPLYGVQLLWLVRE